MDDSVLEKIYKSGLKFLEPISLEQTYQLIVKEVVGLLDADWAGLYLASGRKLQRVTSYPEDSPVQFVYKPRKKGFTYAAFLERKTIAIGRQGIMEAHPELSHQDYESALCIPLSYHGRSIGVLTLLGKSNHVLSEKELSLLKVFGAYASLAIHRSKSYDETNKALETRDLFISMAAHELRTPLTAVSGYIQLLRSKMRSSDSAESRWVEQLYRESIRLGNLVKELLEINRIKTGQLQYFWKECSLRGIMDRVIAGFKFVYPHKELIYDDQLGASPDTIIGDYDKIIQAVTNILDNAVKYSPQDKPVELMLKHRNRDLVIQVKDQGVGIPKNEISKIFEGFYRVDNGYHPEGLGVGLFLVKDIIERHRGQIKIKSKVHKRTVVEVILPGA